MARRRMGMADTKEILVAWDAGESVSAIARRLGYTRLTVRKYGRAAEHIGLVRGGGRRAEAEWDRLAQAALDRVARRSQKPTPAASEITQHHAYLVLIRFDGFSAGSVMARRRARYHDEERPCLPDTGACMVITESRGFVVYSLPGVRVRQIHVVGEQVIIEAEPTASSGVWSLMNCCAWVPAPRKETDDQGEHSFWGISSWRFWGKMRWY